MQRARRRVQRDNPAFQEQFKTIPTTYVLPENYAAFVRDAGARRDDACPRSQSLVALPPARRAGPERGSRGAVSRPPQPLKKLAKKRPEAAEPRPASGNAEAHPTRYIVKPACLLQGQGIFIATLPEIQQWYRTEYREIVRSAPQYDEKVQQAIFAQCQRKNVDVSLEQIQSNYRSGHDLYLIQEYLENPLLINGHKFDCRIYVLVTQFQPALTAYICTEGFARFALKDYRAGGLAAHLTNVAIQKREEDYDNSDGGDGAKMGLFRLFQAIGLRHGRRAARRCQENVETSILRTLQAVAPLMSSNRCSFEVYGFDVMLSDRLESVICEVNACPSLSADTAEDRVVKKRMLHDALSIVVDGRRGDVVGCFHKVFDGRVDERDYDAGRVRTGVLVGDRCRRALHE